MTITEMLIEQPFGTLGYKASTHITDEKQWTRCTKCFATDKTSFSQSRKPELTVTPTPMVTATATTTLTNGINSEEEGEAEDMQVGRTRYDRACV